MKTEGKTFHTKTTQQSGPCISLVVQVCYYNNSVSVHAESSVNQLYWRERVICNH